MGKRTAFGNGGLHLSGKEVVSMPQTGQWKKVNDSGLKDPKRIGKGL